LARLYIQLLSCLLNTHEGWAVAQAVSHWPLTTEARVRARSVHMGFMVDKVTLGQVFYEFFGFRLSI
jgi:hypothetical protein